MSDTGTNAGSGAVANTAADHWRPGTKSPRPLTFPTIRACAFLHKWASFSRSRGTGGPITPESTVASRRRFLRLLASSAAAVALMPRGRALAADEFVLTFPQDPTATYFSATFGAARPGGRRHQGIDLMAPKLGPVFAAHSGVVTNISDGPRSGRYLVVEHSSEWSTWYMHLNNDDPGTDNGRSSWDHTLAPGIEPGTLVQAGQILGFVGDSGNAEGSGSHTHFELHQHGRPINPFPYLVEAFEVAVLNYQAAEINAQIQALCMPGVELPAIDAEVCPTPVGPVSETVVGTPIHD